MTLLIAPDIFGQTPALDRLIHNLQHSSAGANDTQTIKIISPYEDKIFFRNEERAYAYFTANSSIPAYAERIERTLDRSPPPVTLLGFSAGASAIWYLSGQAQNPSVSSAIGFYGSQIRHHRDIIPSFPIQLIFPTAEPHFDVMSLTDFLKSIPGVTCESAPGDHGFMNEFSQNYDPKLHNKYLYRLSPVIKSQIPS